ncbi:MAG TPA: o-succinylbenzoate synthase [Thermofilum sp.]|nr:o-succinylbenzoate synthase [Thermofilum sp.]
MEIRKIVLYVLEMELKDSFKTSFGTLKKKNVVLIKIIDSSGEEGWGEIVAGEGPWYSYETFEVALLIVTKYLVPLILGKSIERAVSAWELMKKVRGHNMAKAGLEMALWDLDAKLQGKPLFKLIGGSRSAIVSGVSIGIKDSIENLIKEVSRRLEEGYARIKVKIEPNWDVQVIRALREEFPDILLQVDANAAYTLDDLPTLKALDDFNLLMIEQPLGYEDLVDHSILARKLHTPICLDESIVSLGDVKAAYKLGSCEIVNVKPGRVGGMYSSLRVLNICDQLGLGCWIGGMLETGVGRGHLVALATREEVRYPNDISASERYWEEDIVEPPWTLWEKGLIKAPERPGIGVEVLEDKIKKRLKKMIKFE